MKTRKKSQTWKFPQITFVVFLVFICILFIQYCYLSLFPVVYGTNMEQFAASRNTYSTTLYAKRGTLYDCDENVLASTISSYTVIAYLPKSSGGRGDDYVQDIQATANALSPVLDMEVEVLVKLMSKDLYQVELGPGGRGITELKKSEIENLNLKGISFIENYKRWYPNGDFASYIIGYAKNNEKEVVVDDKNKIEYSIDGELGIELHFDEILKGINGSLTYQQDRFGYKIPDTEEQRQDAQDGKDIYLTIDSNIQRFVEAAIKEASATYQPELMHITVMDAKTGDILASSSTPSFDPNIRNLTNYENLLTSYLYEPGSTMKTYTYMCAIDKGTYQGSATYDSGTIDMKDAKISDWNLYGWGNISYDLGYQYSSNTAIVNIVQNFITKQDLRDCLEKYGFGQKTNIMLPRELQGDITFNYPFEVATAGFGQGITITAIQQLQALTIIANHGKMLTPHIISKIVDPNTGETIYQRKIEESEQLVKDSTIEKMQELMYLTVNDPNPETTGKHYRIDGFNIMGKTGTAEIYDNAHGHYFSGYNDYIYSFTGMYPREDPQIIIYGFVQRPKTGASTALSNATKSIMASIAKYRNMFPTEDSQKTIKELILPSYTNENIDTAIASLNSSNITPVIIGNGNRIIDQYPKAESKVLSQDKVFLITNGTIKTLPDLTGWARIDITKYCNLVGITCEMNGYGNAVEQSITPNTPIQGSETLIINLQNKYIINPQPLNEEKTN